MKWADILRNWLAVTVDLHEVFGVDTDSEVLDNRHWFWLKDRIIALLDKPSRLRAALNLPANATTS